MLPYKPDDWPRVFEQHLNASDLDAVMALYEPEARFVTPVRRNTGRSRPDSQGAGRHDRGENAFA
jgi:hypothetical protein